MVRVVLEKTPYVILSLITSEPKKISSITPVLTIAKAGGWNGDKDNKSRKLLSDLKHLFTNYNDLSFHYLKSQTEEFLSSDNKILFIHMREPEEIGKYLKYATEKQLTYKTLLIKRDPMEHKIYGNDADDMVDCYQYDFTYHNDLPLTEVEKDFITFFKNNILKVCDVL